MIEIEVTGGGGAKIVLTVNEVEAMKLPGLSAEIADLRPGFTRVYDVEGYGKVRVRRHHS